MHYSNCYHSSTTCISLYIAIFALVIILSNTAAALSYFVTPDDHFGTTCHHCQNLQYYMLNITKYFTSNTQLFFLPGLHHLYNDLIIQDVHNISLIGSTANSATLDTVIQCNSSVGIMITNITDLTIAKLVIENCNIENDIDDWTYKKNGLILSNCYNVHLQSITVYRSDQLYNSTILALNIFGVSSFGYVTSYALKIQYDETKVDYKNNKLTIENFQIPSFPDYINSDIGIRIYLYQQTYKIEIEMCNIKFAATNKTGSLFFLIQGDNTLGNFIHFNQCIVENTTGVHLFYFMSSIYKNHHQITFTYCVFRYNTYDTLFTVHGEVNIKLAGCIFRYNQLQSEMIKMTESLHQNLMTIINTSFYAITSNSDLIHISNVVLHLDGPVIFRNLKAVKIFDAKHSTIICYEYIEFSDNNLFLTDQINYINVQENTTINMTNNEYHALDINPLRYYSAHSITNFTAPCYYQYTADGQNFDNFSQILNISIIFHNDISVHSLLTAHCMWIHGSAFTITRPIDINKRIIRSDRPLYNKIICYCFHDGTQDCSRDTLATIFPGQTVSLSLILNHQYPTYQHFLTDEFINYNHTFIVEPNNNILPQTACKLAKVSELIQKVYYSPCAEVNLTVVQNKLNYLPWCELFITLLSTNQIDAYYVDMLPCPAGFAYHNGICICDPILNLILPIETCDINHQTIVRPANSWLSAITVNNSHQYYISPQCPLQYCLPQSSQFNFSTPSSQCQFNRSGLLCGQCQQGLSTVFGYSHCQRCSNVYLLLIMPMAIAGLVLVFLLFILNLTVANGDINGFILHINIISINDHVFFPQYSNSISMSFLNTFVSFTNLDLGISTCFYEGMDDYAKMWLQLVFPAYLVLIATIFIIASRHSTKLQRITACRAVPVLATLFLLSYTKILRTISSVLFNFSSITHLPSGHTTLVWAIDGNVPLFGLKYSMLFIICLFLFIILLPFNAILCFTKTAMRIQSINQFKPIIDAYQGPYKYNYYYWTGLQLVIRAAFFGLSALDKSANLIISTALLAAISIVQAKISPFKSEYKNINDLCFLYNLLVTFIFSYRRNNVVIEIMITMAALQFLFIIIHHIIISACGGTVIYKIRKNSSKIIAWITRSYAQNKEQQIKLNNVPPNVAFNYSEYQEPLISYN